jgi:hypothetical protein
MLNAAGGIVDDIIVWWLEPERMVVLPNGVNHDTVAMHSQLPERVQITDLRPARPSSRFRVPGPALLGATIGLAPKRFRVIEQPPLVAAGPDTPASQEPRSSSISTTRVHVTPAAGAVPCGLGARDVLRLEMGYPLWGQDLDTTTTPLEAGLGVIGWDHDFVGRRRWSPSATGVGRTSSALPSRPPGASHGQALAAGHQGERSPPGTARSSRWGSEWAISATTSAGRRHRDRRGARGVVPRPPGRSPLSGALMDFTPHTPADLEQMLSALGMKSVEDLFAHIPTRLRTDPDPGLPAPLSEPEVMARIAALGREVSSGLICFAGRRVRPLPRWCGR